MSTRLLVGQVVCATKKPELGAGLLIGLEPEKARVFFLNQGPRAFHPERAGLQVGLATTAEEAVYAILRDIPPADWGDPLAHHRVYAIELSHAVRDDFKFRSGLTSTSISRPCDGSAYESLNRHSRNSCGVGATAYGRTDVDAEHPTRPRRSTVKEAAPNDTCLLCRRGLSFDLPRQCPERDHVFAGKGWEGLDAHWKAHHLDLMPYEELWRSLCREHRGEGSTWPAGELGDGPGRGGDMAGERKLHLLTLAFESARDRGDSDSQLAELEKLLNEGWNILQAIPLGAAGGITAVSPGADGASEPLRFAQWAALIVLQRGGQERRPA